MPQYRFCLMISIKILPMIVKIFSPFLALMMGVFYMTINPPLSFANDETSPYWQEIVQKAKGQTVHWNAWGGSEQYNAYMAWAAAEVEGRYGVKVKHVKLSDTAEAVRQVIAEKAAAKHENGAVDVIWINGENFASMKKNKLLYGPFVEKLPNFSLVDTLKNPTSIIDFTIPTDGLEAPYGKAQLIFIYDSHYLKSPPKTAAAILKYAKENKGRITYPAPPDFIGTSFLKQLLLSLTSDDLKHFLYTPPGDNADIILRPLWQYLQDITPHLRHAGKQYPKTGEELITLLDNREIDIAYSFNIGAASNAILEDRLAPTARSYILDGGTIGNSHFLAIPYNATAKEGAMILINFLMSPEAQARKQDTKFWGEATILSFDKMSAEQQKYFANIQIHPATLTARELGTALSEPHPEWMRLIEKQWTMKFGG